MNVIPLVTTFIIIIGLFSLSQMQSVKYIVQEKRVYTTRQNLLKDVRLEMAKDYYYKNVTPNHTPKNTPNNDKKTDDTPPTQDDKTKNGNTKDSLEKLINLNLAAVIKTPENAFLEKAFLNAIVAVYQKENPDAVRSLFKEIIQVEKEILEKNPSLSSLIPLVKLRLKSGIHQDLLFRLLQGAPVSTGPSLLKNSGAR
ncbi:hypothetical protein COB21_03875 [Candidatus Aerophobetes bacterium]|uniref:Uncharacterized protein n=1 Tax=Aerophobetes bacterium TaxID=2030807 RepID=A0A2A4X266_UNCAE|nr:MAG: hypothetical protein COB21_03875 [Candidatus Aerophobetes bacterium]